MGRKGKKTLLKTTVLELLVKLIDAYIEKKAKTGYLTEQKRMSRAEVIEKAFLFYVFLTGDLEELLKSHGFPNEKAKNITMNLQQELDSVLKARKIKE